VPVASFYRVRGQDAAREHYQTKGVSRGPRRSARCGHRVAV